MAGSPRPRRGSCGRGSRRNPRHAAALAALEQTWAELGAVRRSGQAAQLWTEVEAWRQRRRLRRRRAVGAVLGLAAAFAILLAIPRPDRRAPADRGRAGGEAGTEVRRLADGSVVALRAGAVIEVDFQQALRRVRLVRGEALFSGAERGGATVRGGNRRRRRARRGDGIFRRAAGRVCDRAGGGGAGGGVVSSGRIRPCGHPRGGRAAGRAWVSACSCRRGRIPAGARGEAAGRPAASRRRPRAGGGVAGRPRLAGAAAGVFGYAFGGGGAPAQPRPAGVPLVLADPRLNQRAVTGVIWSDGSDEPVRLLEAGFGSIPAQPACGPDLRARD